MKVLRKKRFYCETGRCRQNSIQSNKIKHTELGIASNDREMFFLLSYFSFFEFHS